MSMIAAMILAGSAAPTGVAPLTAEAVLEAHRAKTSIGPDPCRSTDPEEIVVCARSRDEFATPLYTANDDPDARYGGDRVGQMQAIKEVQCRAQGLDCAKKGSINLLAVGGFVIGGIKALLGEDD